MGGSPGPSIRKYSDFRIDVNCRTKRLYSEPGVYSLFGLTVDLPRTILTLTASHLW